MLSVSYLEGSRGNINVNSQSSEFGLRFYRLFRGELLSLVRYLLAMVLPFLVAWSAFVLLRPHLMDTHLALLISQLAWLLVSYPFVAATFWGRVSFDWHALFKWFSVWFGTVFLAQALVGLVALLGFEDWLLFLVNSGLVTLTTYLLARLWVFARN